MSNETLKITKPLAIHYNKGGFTDRWIEYCTENNITFRKVDCYDFKIIDILKECSGLMWHWSHDNYKDLLFARQLIISLKKLCIKTFPNIETCWHFDDKIGQKYLFEAIDAPFTPTYIFYEKEKAIEWAKNTGYPKVFKLRCGAGSKNVKLVKDYKTAVKLINRAFSGGFYYKNKIDQIRDRFLKFSRKKSKENFVTLLKGYARYFIHKPGSDLFQKEKGYVYFQDFIPGNAFDTRLIVIGKRCFGVRRHNRKNDFRASGSGLLSYNPEFFDQRCMKIAFEISKKLMSQSLALDFLFNKDKEPVVVEISYAFPTGAFTDDCPGYWDEFLKWHEGRFNVQHLMVENFMNELALNYE